MLPRRGLTDNTGAEAGFELRLLARHCEPEGSGGGGRKVALALASPPLGANRPARMRGSVAAPRGGGSESQVQAQLQATSSFSSKPTGRRGVTAGNGAGACAPARPAVGAAGEPPARSAFSKPAAIRDTRCVNICPRRHLRRPSFVGILGRTFPTLGSQGAAEKLPPQPFPPPEFSSANLSQSASRLGLSLTAPPPSSPSPHTFARLLQDRRLHCVYYARVLSH